jgi:hypothetical protein
MAMTRPYVYDRKRSGQVSEKHRREIQLFFLDEGLGKCLKPKIVCILQEKAEGKQNEYGNNTILKETYMLTSFMEHHAIVLPTWAAY